MVNIKIVPPSPLTTKCYVSPLEETRGSVTQRPMRRWSLTQPEPPENATLHKASIIPLQRNRLPCFLLLGVTLLCPRKNQKKKHCFPSSLTGPLKRRTRSWIGQSKNIEAKVSLHQAESSTTLSSTSIPPFSSSSIIISLLGFSTASSSFSFSVSSLNYLSSLLMRIGNKVPLAPSWEETFL